MSEILITFYRSIITIAFLFFITKMLGHKQIAELTLYDYIVGIVIGSIAADAIISIDKSIFNGIIAMLTYGGAALLMSYLALKNDKANKVLNGKPIKLMENGKFNIDEMKKSMFNVDMFLEECRTHGIYDVTQVDTVYLENSGRTSVLLKSEYQNLTPNDLKSNFKTNKIKQVVSYSLIIDGVVQKEELENSGKNEKWLFAELKKKNIKLDNILLASYNDKLKIYEK